MELELALVVGRGKMEKSDRDMSESIPVYKQKNPHKIFSTQLHTRMGLFQTPAIAKRER